MKIKESELRNIISESVRKVVNEISEVEANAYGNLALKLKKLYSDVEITNDDNVYEMFQELEMYVRNKAML